jgi:hypothetical protein
MPRESAIAAMVGSIQLFITIYVQTYDSDVIDPRLFSIGYISAAAHLYISGIIVHRQNLTICSKCTLLAACIVAVITSVFIVYHIKKEFDKSIWYMYLINFHAIVVVVAWGGIIIHILGRKSAIHKPFGSIYALNL